MTHPLLQEHPPPGSEQRRIAHLTRSTAHLVRSAVVIPTLPQILAELVQNSLDAKATSISCAVDLDTWTVRCEDNGTGFTANDLETLARTGRYATSKVAVANDTGSVQAAEPLSAVETYGFRGEALASLQHLATLEIRSRSITDPDGRTHELVAHGGDCLALGESAVERPNHGATVIVRDIFHKFPVRRRVFDKPNALASCLSSFRSTLASLALINPSVAFSLVDTTSSSIASSSVSSNAKVLLNVRSSPSGSVVTRWKQLWGPAGVEKVYEVCESESQPPRPAGMSSGGDQGLCRAAGFFSLSPAHSKAQQFIYVNSRPLLASQSPLHKLVNALFDSSTFAKHASSSLASVSADQQGRKSFEKNPIFVLALRVPGKIVDVSLEPQKSVVEFEDPARIEAFVTAIVKRFLAQHGFSSRSHPSPTIRRPASATEAISKPSSSPKRSRAASVEGHVDSEGQADRQPGLAKRTKPLKATALCRSFSEGPTIRQEGCDDVRQPVPRAGARVEAGDDGIVIPDGFTLWTDPQTSIVWEIDPRTGNSRRADLMQRMSPVTDEVRSPMKDSPDERSGIVDRRSLKSGGGDGAVQAEMPQWLQKSLGAWQNPVFPAAAPRAAISRLPELPIASKLAQTTIPDTFASGKRPRAPRVATRDIGTFCCTSAAVTSSAPMRDRSLSGTPDLTSLRLSSPAPTASSTQTFSRESLEHAEYIAQVDAKYLLVKLPLKNGQESGATLVLVDQHAASERVRVEQFFEVTAGAVLRGEAILLSALSAESDGAETKSKPIGIVLGRPEYETALQHRDAFARWGLTLRFDNTTCDAMDLDVSGDQKAEYRQVWLDSVPEIVAGRLIKDAQLAQDLVRSYVAHLEERGPGSVGLYESKRQGTGWTTAVKDMPPVLVDLINSKACRGAIMFNDVLSPQQAEALLSKLAQTVYPFQCAHGRPSLVPLVNLAPAASVTNAAGFASEVDWSRFSI